MRSAIVGCGNVAQVHARAIEGMEGAELIAVADIVAEKADSMAAQYGAKAYYDLEEMLASVQIDVLHICTPHYLHMPMTVQALKAGIHVFMEKPPIINSVQWEELKQAVKQCEEKAR